MRKRVETKAPATGAKVDFRSAVGIDPGLATCGIAHVTRTMIGVAPPGDPIDGLPEYALCDGRRHQPCGGVFRSEAADEDTVAESNATRVRDLMHWLRPRLQSACDAGCEVVAAERYEHLRQSSSAAKLSAAHAAVVAVTSEIRQRALGWSGLPAYPSAREVKRAVVGCDVASKRVVEAAVARLVVGARMSFEVMRKLRRAGDVEHFADACAVALHALGHRSKVLFLADGCDVIPERDRGAFEAMTTTHSPGGRAVICTEAWIETIGMKLPADWEFCAWFEADRGEGRFMAAVLPTPGSEWWRRKANANKARLFLRAAARLP